MGGRGRGRPGGRGRFELRWLEPGDHELVVEAQPYVEERASVVAVAGRRTPVDVRLSPVGPLGSIRGVLRSRTGRYEPRGVSLSLVRVGEPDLYRILTPTYRERDGELVAPFELDDLPEGEYRLELDPSDNRRWDPRELAVSVPADGLELVCRDDLPTFDLRVHAVDADGRSVPRPETLVWLGDPLDDARLRSDWRSGIYEDVTRGVPLEWIVGAPGHRLARGDESDLRADGDGYVLEVSLERGFGQVFVVTTRDLVPLEGVELVADGELVGATDERGIVLLDADARPRSLRFELEGWAVASGDVDASEPTFGRTIEVPVWLDRE